MALKPGRALLSCPTLSHCSLYPSHMTSLLIIGYAIQSPLCNFTSHQMATPHHYSIFLTTPHKIESTTHEHTNLDMSTGPQKYPI